MKRSLTLMLFVLIALLCAGQSDKKPYWIDNTPTPKKGNYYYRVTFGEGRNYDKAYAKAFARAILESSWKLGVAVDTKDDVQALENNITENVNVSAAQMVLPLNKVCEHVEIEKTTMNTKVYVLWQVAKYANKPPEFESFNKCK